MKEIKLTQGKVALVDDEDYEYLNQWKWQFSSGYARRNIRLLNGKRSSQSMHRLILNVPSLEFLVDHINGNKLDNRKENLRTCDSCENAWNRGVKKENKLRIKGVSFKKEHSRYVAVIQVKKKQLHLGYFYCPIEAARAYNSAAILHHGKFARLNEIPA